MTERSTLVVSKNTWHGRLWHWWRDNSDFKNGVADSYRENLCHYVRIVAFWGPLSLFLKYPLGRWFITPFTVLATAVGVSGFGYVLINHPGDTLEVIATIIAISTLIAMGVLSILYIHDHQDAIVTWWEDDGYGTHPIKAVGRFLARPVLRVPVACWLFAATIIVCSILVDVMVGLMVLATIGAFAALMAFAVLMSVLVEKIKARKAAKENKPKPEEGAFRVAGRFVVAKKHRVCPFIEVAD